MSIMTSDTINVSSEPIIYQLEHSRLVACDDIYDTKLIGFFLTRDDTARVIEEYRQYVGFRDYPQDFRVCEMPLNAQFPRQRISLPCNVYYLFYWKENVQTDVDYMQDIGVFSSRERAVKAKEQWVTAHACDKSEENCLYIERYKVGQCFWREGFV